MSGLRRDVDGFQVSATTTRRKSSPLDRGPHPVGHDGLNFRTIVARHPGKCRRCGAPINPGDPVRWAPKRGTYHLKDYCGNDDAALESYEEKYGPVDVAPVDHATAVPASITGEVF